MSSYREAGVDVAAGDRFVAAIADTVTATWDENTIGRFGGFAGGVRLPGGYERPVLMLATDGVGTKTELARAAGRYDGLGRDLVAMCVDDLAAAGARPVALTDYLTVGRLHAQRDAAIVASIAAGCREAGCALVGGETAEHPGVLAPDQFDLGGTALGIVEEGAEITGAAITPGDKVVAVASPNLRANGFSLIRHVVLPEVALDEELSGTGRAAENVLLEPAVIYTPAVLAAIAAAPVHGLAHITGGGLPGNVLRVLPEHCRVVIDTATWTPPPVFAAVAALGEVPVDEMFATFNMGVGFVAVVPPDAEAAVITEFARHGHDAWEAGVVIEGKQGVDLA